MPEMTFGRLKNRILEALNENTDGNGVVFSDDERKSILISRMPNTVHSCLVRMYESLPVGIKCAGVRLINPKKVFECMCVPREGVCFETDCLVLGISFYFYGEGSLYILDENGTDVFDIQCGKTQEKSLKQVFVTLGKAGKYTICSTEQLFVTELSVYEKDCLDNEAALPPKGFVSLEVPENFEKLLAVDGQSVFGTAVQSERNAGYAYISGRGLSDRVDVLIHYKEKIPEISEETDDNFIFNMSHLGFEALICLCGAELCRAEDASLYSRLYYKYCDLSEGLHRGASSKRTNSFFQSSKKMRW